MPLPPIERLGPARLVVTDRTGGVSRSPWNTLNLAEHVGDDLDHVASNRDRVRAHLQAESVAVVKAEHAAVAREVSTSGTADAADILITRQPGLALLVLAADCIPAVLVAPDVGALAVVHAGWRGVMVDAAGEAVAALVGLGADPVRLLARLGPSICASCYEVSAQVRDQVAAAAPPAGAVAGSGAPAVDLAAGFSWQLRRRGVAAVEVDPRCTNESEELFSYRRDGRTGRHGVLAVLGD